MKVWNAILTIVLIILIAAIVYLGVYFLAPHVLPRGVRNATDRLFGALEDTGIDGEGLTFDAEEYPYHEFLSEQGKKLYAQVYANACEVEDTFVPIVELSISEVENVITAVFHDHPELFWMESGYSYKYNEKKICIQIMLSFNETAKDIKKTRKELYAVVDEIVDGANPLSSDYEKEKYVHDVIMERAEYNGEGLYHQSAYGALVDGKAVCAGYARAFQLVMMELGIPTYYCAGKSEGHAWNIIKLDGGYYNVDVTWNDRNFASHFYFNRTDEEVESSHKRSGYSVLLPKCKAKEYVGYK